MNKEEVLRKMIAAKEIPATIYKYASIDTAKLIVKKSSLKFSCPFDFNDPFECRANISTDATLDEIVKFFLTFVIEGLNSHQNRNRKKQ